jgi:hypothetical protein
MSELSSNRGRVVFISEASYGTDAVDTAYTTATSDIIYQDVRSITFNPPEVVDVEIPRVRHTNGGVKSGKIPNKGAASIEIGLTGFIAASAGNEVPYYSALLKASQLAETTTSGDKSTYTPATQQQDAMTLYYYMQNLENNNERLTYMTGVRAASEITFELDSEPYLSAELVGQFYEVTDDLAFHSASNGQVALRKDGSPATPRSTGEEKYADKEPIMCNNATITVDDVTYPCSNITFALNYTLDEKRTVNGGASSLDKVIATKPATGARVMANATIIDGDAAFDNIMSNYVTGSEIGVFCAAQNENDRIEISGSGGQILGTPSFSQIGNLISLDIQIAFNKSWSEMTDRDSWQMTFTSSV